LEDIKCHPPLNLAASVFLVNREGLNEYKWLVKVEGAGWMVRVETRSHIDFSEPTFIDDPDDFWPKIDEDTLAIEGNEGGAIEWLDRNAGGLALVLSQQVEKDRIGRIIKFVGVAAAVLVVVYLFS
jgi:hypothetical protein